MEILLDTILYALAHQVELGSAVRQHLGLTLSALGIALVLGAPAGLWTARSKTVSIAILGVVNSLRVIPSLAVLFLAIPYFGLSLSSAIIALTLLALPPIVLNTDAAFRSLDPAVLDVARGMGMTGRQILWRVEIPLALPVALSGLRTAAVEVISSATLAAFIGIGGLGIYITRGFALFDYAILMVGAIPVALLTLGFETLLGLAQKQLTPPGLVVHPG